MVKRGVDILLSAMLLLVAAPVLLFSAVIIAITSPGPVIFRQTRIGREFRPFTLFKLRTMAHNAPGSEYTLGDDPRITPFGQWLRSTKIDELPQLWNVLRGEMSLVGPRPVIPRLTEEFRVHYRLLLRARPGLTDPASLKYRRETELIQLAADKEDFFRYTVTPDKINISMQYMEKASFWTDLGVLLMTGLVCPVPSLSRLYGRPPRPSGAIRLKRHEAPQKRAEVAPVWARTDTTLLPQAADFRMVEDLTVNYGKMPWNLLSNMEIIAQSSRNPRDRSVSRL